MVRRSSKIRPSSRSTRVLLTLALSATAADRAFAQQSLYALHMYAHDNGVGDRVTIAIDDDSAGADQSQPNDLGGGSFTLEFWVRGSTLENTTIHAGGHVETADDAWRAGNLVIDRSVDFGTERVWGVSIAGGLVRFGTGRGDSGTPGFSDNTLEGNVCVLDDAWHHVACTRDFATGIKCIYIDGVLDFASAPDASKAVISYPNAGVNHATIGPQIVLGARKYTQGPGASFNGFLDEVRMWTLARTAGEIAASFDRICPADEPGLVGYYRFEEGLGTTATDTCALSRAGVVGLGVPFNGEWVSGLSDPANTAPVSGQALPNGFTHAVLADDLFQPTALECAADGRIFIGELSGDVRVWDGGQMLQQPVIEIETFDIQGEFGLLGLALDPDFASNGWLYANFITPEPRNRVSRFTVVGNVANPASEVVIWENYQAAYIAQNGSHHGGAIAFGPDGHLYIGTGEQLPSGSPQSLAHENGKVLRLEPDGSIPADNPFVGFAGAREAIWATGLRNAFRFDFDSLTGELWIGDVGGNTSSSWEELERGAAGANYGWPDQDGPVCHISDCSALTFPSFAYRHDDSELGDESEPQGCIIAGVVYRGGAFPPEYQGNVFFADYANRWIRRAVIDGAGVVTGVHEFMAPPAADSVVDLAVGKDGALYYLGFGLDYDHAALHRIDYIPGTNLIPVAIAGAQPLTGRAPLSVQFNSVGSFDPDAGPAALSYAWDFDDGATSTSASPVHVFATKGRYEATLTVSDSAASVSAVPLEILVGRPPVAVIKTPMPGALYRGSETIHFRGLARDPDDSGLPLSALTWNVVLVHAGHVHPFLGPLSGVTAGSFVVPTSGHAPGETHYEIRLDVVDADGLPGSAARAIYPDLALLTIDTLPSGIPVFIDGEAHATPFSATTLIGFEHVLDAQSTFPLAGTTYEFASWSDGLPQSHAVVVPPQGVSLIVHYSAVGG